MLPPFLILHSFSDFSGRLLRQAPSPRDLEGASASRFLPAWNLDPALILDIRYLLNAGMPEKRKGKRTKSNDGG